MNNLLISLKRFFKNKNTVTILGVVAIVFILKFGYDNQISSQVSPVTVYVAKETIQPRVLITEAMIEEVKVPKMLSPENNIRSKTLIIGQYSNFNTMIPKGSMFFEENLVDKKDLPNSSFTEVEEGDVVYNFPVDLDSTYGNSVFPGDNIDIYMKAVNDEGIIMVGKFIENIKVLAVKDAAGQHVFENSEESRRPANFIFGVDPELNILLRKASFMGNYSVVLFPVPHGGVPLDEDDPDYEALKVNVTSENLKEFINTHTVPNDDLDPSLIDEDELDDINDNQEDINEDQEETTE